MRCYNYDIIIGAEWVNCSVTGVLTRIRQPEGREWEEIEFIINFKFRDAIIALGPLVCDYVGEKAVRHLNIAYECVATLPQHWRSAGSDLDNSIWKE
jgi:hypothetical protein